MLLLMAKLGFPPTDSTSYDPHGTGPTLPSLGIPRRHLSSFLALGPHSPSPRLEPAPSRTWRWIWEPSWERMEPVALGLLG